MEMNTRIQVEHCVTEEVTGIDLIKEQIRVASGKKLSFAQKDVQLTGHAIECRINAENPDKNFTPNPGRIDLFIPPGGIGVRMDTHAYSGYTIPPYYDSMIGKLIVHGKDRKQALERCRRALEEFIVEGVSTTIPFQLEVLHKKDFCQGHFDTGFLEKMIQEKGK
jgi:acetyl-CoA carboxylase biotin carboxylase subunit